MSQKVVGSTHKDAIDDYDKTIKLNPDYADAYFNRGVVKNALGDHKGAINDFEKTIKLNPSYKKKLQPIIGKLKKKL